MTVIELTSPREAQRMLALEKANHVRVTNARLFREITGLEERDARALCAAVFTDPTDEQNAAKVDQLLRAVPRFGAVKVRGLLVHADIRVSGRRVGELSQRQRTLIASVLLNPASLWTSTSMQRVAALPAFCEAETEAAA